MKKSDSKKQIANSKEQKFDPKLFAICFLLSAFCYGQGFLPPQQSTSSVSTNATHGPIQIGERMPETYTGITEAGKRRGLLTYKSAIEIMVIAFYASPCPKNVMRWHEMSQFYDHYKDWRVSFLAVNVGPPASQADLVEQMRKADLQFPIIDDEDHSLISACKIESIPEYLILDEQGYLRYRGPMGKDARAALDALIDHMIPVPDPEPSLPAGCPVS